MRGAAAEALLAAVRRVGADRAALAHLGRSGLLQAGAALLTDKAPAARTSSRQVVQLLKARPPLLSRCRLAMHDPEFGHMYCRRSDVLVHSMEFRHCTGNAVGAGAMPTSQNFPHALMRSPGASPASRWGQTFAGDSATLCFFLLFFISWIFLAVGGGPWCASTTSAGARTE